MAEIENREQALAKAEEVYKEANQYKTVPELTEHLKEIAEKYKGRLHHSGGGIYVVLIPFDKHHTIGVSDGDACVILYYNPKDSHTIEHTRAYEIFYGDDTETVKTWELCQ